MTAGTVGEKREGTPAGKEGSILPKKRPDEKIPGSAGGALRDWGTKEEMGGYFGGMP